jgi:hypothetical protein
MLRPYLEQARIPDFDGLDTKQRISQVQSYRKSEVLRLQRIANPKLLKQTKKNYKQTENYIHLTLNERKQFIKEIATSISRWGFARLFAECVDKVYFDPARTPQTISEQSFEQLVSRFEQYLHGIGKKSPNSRFGLLIHDNNETIAKKHTVLMNKFHQSGTLWTKIENIIETPLFVDSQLTSMIQIADVCAYALRRYLENGEEELFELIFQRADRKDNIIVGIRHFTRSTCGCKICIGHRKASSLTPVSPL